MTSHAEEARPDDPGAELMLAFQAGDETAFDRLVELYSGCVYALCTRFLGEVAGREDLVQETFVRVLRARQRYRPTARFSTWLYRIAFNLCANWRERRREPRSLDAPFDDGSRAPEPAAGPPASTDDPSAALERRDVVRAVRDAVASLPEKQRMALILAKYEELSHAEIAAVLDSSEKAIKSLVHRARERLRELLAPLLEEEPA